MSHGKSRGAVALGCISGWNARFEKISRQYRRVTDNLAVSSLIWNVKKVFWNVFTVDISWKHRCRMMSSLFFFFLLSLLSLLYVCKWSCYSWRPQHPPPPWTFSSSLSLPLVQGLLASKDQPVTWPRPANRANTMLLTVSFMVWCQTVTSPSAVQMITRVPPLEFSATLSHTHTHAVNCNFRFYSYSIVHAWTRQGDWPCVLTQPLSCVHLREIKLHTVPKLAK